MGRLFAADLQLSSPLFALLCKNLLLGSPRHLLRSPRAAAASSSSYYCPPPPPPHHPPFTAVRDGSLRRRCADHVRRPRQLAQRRRGCAPPGGGSSRAVRDPPGFLLLPPGNPIPPPQHIASSVPLGLGPLASDCPIYGAPACINTQRPDYLVCCFAGDHFGEGIGLSPGCAPPCHGLF